MADAPAAHDEVLTGWGRTAPSRSQVWEPRRADEILALLDGNATGAHGRGIIARGLGRSYGDAAQNGGGAVVRCTGLDRVISLDVEKGRCTVEAGVSIETLMRVLLPLGWFPTVVPGTRHVTVGGAIASDIHGKYRHGSFADSVEHLRLVTPARGALTVGPGDEPEIFRATAGGMGLTGIVTEATLRLQPVETSSMVVDTERAVDVDDCMARMLDGDHRYRYSVAWIDCLARGAHLGRSVLTRGNHAAAEWIPAAKRARARDFAPRTLLRAPRGLPDGLLNPVSIRAFNELWFRKAPREERGRVQGITGFFHPLDAVLDWNRIYGPHGFVQYQFVVPYGAEPVVRAVLERLSARRCASFLAVLKRFEHDSVGLLGFPTAGWTLALDLPARRGARHAALRELLDGRDEQVVGAGGRVYLSKDSRLRAGMVPAMYPQLERWREVRAALDPDAALGSDMDRRLDLTGAGPRAA